MTGVPLPFQSYLPLAGNQESKGDEFRQGG